MKYVAYPRTARWPRDPIHGPLRRAPYAFRWGDLTVRMPQALLHRQCRLRALRVAVPASVLAPYLTLVRPFVGAGALQQNLADILLVLVISIAQSLLDRHVAAQRRGTPVPAMISAIHEVTPVAQHSTQTAPAVRPTPPCPVPATCKAFDDAVRRAITHLCDPTKLALSPLLQLSLVTAGLHDQGLEDTRFQRVAILKAVLTELVHGLRPRCGTDGSTSAASRFYNCLHYPYVQGITRRRAPTVLRDLRERRERTGGPRSAQEQVLTWLLQVDEDTYYKWQRRASDAIAHILREREHLLGGSIAAESAA